MKPTAKHLHANRSYHDRVAKNYDRIYSGPRWEAWNEISWTGLKHFVPTDLRAPIIDLGCGTGRFGLKLAKSGYHVTLQDLSQGMLEISRRKAMEMGVEDKVEFHHSDVMDLSRLPASTYALAIAQGDVLSFAASPSKALKAIARLLQPEGVLVASIDQTHAALLHYAEKSDLDGLEKLICTGEMTWLARDPKERFPVHTFTPEKLKRTLEKCGFDCLDLFGKTVLPFKKLEGLFEDKASVRKIMALERKLCRQPSAMGLASHLQFAARLKGQRA